MFKEETAIEHCRRCVVEEERLGNQAPTREAGERHYQLAMLYRAQLGVLERKESKERKARVSSPLAGRRVAEAAAVETAHFAL